MEGWFSRVNLQLYGDPAVNEQLSGPERLRLWVLGGARTYGMAILTIVALFTPLTLWLAPELALYNAVPRTLLWLGTLGGVWLTYRPWFRGSGVWLVAVMCLGLSSMVLLEVALPGTPNHPWMHAPAYFLIGVALIVPVPAKYFMVLALAITGLPLVFWLPGWIEATSGMLGLYLTFTGTVALVGSFVGRQRREQFLRECEAEARLLEQKLALEEALQQVRRTQRQLVGADRMALLGRLVVGLEERLKGPLDEVRTQISRAHANTRKLKAGDEAVMLMLRSATAQMLKAATAADDVKVMLAELAEQAKTIGDTESRLFDVFQEVRNAVRVVEWQAESAGLSIEVLGIGSIEVQGDAGKFTQVVASLLALAIDRCERAQRGSEIVVDVAIDSEGVLVHIIDSGSTIPPAVASRLFEPMAIGKESGAQTGLELAICRDMLAAAFGGDLRYVANPGGGATFTLLLPPVLEVHPDSEASLGASTNA
jgi:signal transduction histidine kinase